MPITSTNPYTGRTTATFNEWTATELHAVLDEVHAGYLGWKKTELPERAAKLRAVAAILRNRAGEFAAIMTAEMGKPVSQGTGEAQKCALVCDYYADNAPAMLEPQILESDASTSYVVRDPMGTVLAVMPWNFPFWQVFRIAAPVLMGGNAMVLKHASNVPQCALAIEQVFREVGLGHVFRTLMIGARQVESVIAHPSVIGVSLTGSGPAGAQVAASAGKYLKKSLLELGGSDPFVVLADADLDLAVREGILSRYLNAGQTCIAAKRFIIEESVYDAFTTRFVKAAGALAVGDPTDPTTVVGPLSKADYCADLIRQIDASVTAGAKLLLGGTPQTEGSAVFLPTVLGDVVAGMPAFDEETFGPVAALIRARDEEHALELANQTPFGLGASVWTSAERGQRLARRMDAGAVFVNGMVKSDPRLPFGGIKESGFGRELASNGLYEFLNTKSVWVR